jgi:hypothetical protein
MPQVRPGRRSRAPTGGGSVRRAARRRPARPAHGPRRRRRCCARAGPRPDRGTRPTRCAGLLVARPRPRPSAPGGCPAYLWQPGTSTRGLPVDSGSSRRWLTAPGWCRGPGSGVSPTAQRPEGLDGGAGLAHHHRASEKITSGDQVWCMRVLLAGLGLAAGFPGASGAPAYLGARPGARVRRQDGDGGVSTGAAARSWSAVQREGRQQQGCRELTAGSSVDRARHAARGVHGQAAGARTWSSRLRRVWWQRRASLRAIDSSASWPPRRALTCWK